MSSYPALTRRLPQPVLQPAVELVFASQQVTRCASRRCRRPAPRNRSSVNSAQAAPHINEHTGDFINGFDLSGRPAFSRHSQQPPTRGLHTSIDFSGGGTTGGAPPRHHE